MGLIRLNMAYPHGRSMARRDRFLFLRVLREKKAQESKRKSKKKGPELPGPGDSNLRL
jgi:hypothetical protein